MIGLLSTKQSNITVFSSDKKKLSDSRETHLLDDKFSTHVNRNIQKFESAFIDYPVKGLSGDVNSNYYEFLTMGVIPYVAGSVTLIALFNLAGKYLDLFSKEKASNIGKKFGLGVILFAVMKELSKCFVSNPVKYATGVNINKPYVNKVFNLPKGDGKTNGNDTVWQQRTVFDSKEFYRKDLLDKEYFANVAKKIGLGENLNDPESEVSPIIQTLISTTKTASSISSYLWGALGVCLASQDSWVGFFKSFSDRKRFIKNKDSGFMSNAFGYTKNSLKNIGKISLKFIKAFGNSFVQMWKGKPYDSVFMRHTGKFILAGTIGITSFLTVNAIMKAKKQARKENMITIDTSKKISVI